MRRCYGTVEYVAASPAALATQGRIEEVVGLDAADTRGSDRTGRQGEYGGDVDDMIGKR